jgi:hypothetical protein
LWGNAASGNLNPLSFVITNPNPTVSSLFGSLGASQVALAVVPIGHGHVTINPRTNLYNLNQMVTLTATADPNQAFLGWSGDANGAQNPLSVSMTQSKTIFANFSRNNSLSLQLSPNGLSDGVYIDLNGEIGTVYRLDASANFLTWTPLYTLTNYVGTLHYIDSGVTNFNRRFYRGVALP